MALLHALLFAAAAGTASLPLHTMADTLVQRTDSLQTTYPAPELVPSRTALDTVARRRSVVYSDAYGTRLTIHRYASYTMLPLFGAQYLLGDRLLTQKDDAFAGRRLEGVDPSLRRTHALVAGGVATLFLVNTTTGLWNLYEGRNDPNGRVLRRTHALLMLAADAGFTIVGVLGGRAKDGTPADARRHRNVALGSMTVATGGAALMWLASRR